ncbi:nucleotidyl transferase AbiEii/AbiGii toxin family protein [Flavobacterium sp. SORGH_AS_0622]|jgi:hypothetical protein|uniref:nucleotidyl transferase AbiEii/AbiGii toxin family protein n=1 Tax=Flavobacterium sp. SORGH_AS_0622 TaxID=3041772 RepID=UPI0027824F5A|nr:nucleotidyl transferase AbiEii/AbiGii toxin family protein [Flavobacterium sp. SORGH_AS_0622]MDQ1164600.1 hypothetical protein [Flavobacterium sp. SORGH_AS_0622]
MINKQINLGVVGEVAAGLQELRERVVFIGGAVISLYTDDPAADEVRPTKDIDMTINLANFSEWAAMQERLSDLEFYPDPQGKSIVSYQYKGIAIDIMPADDSAMGPSNRWYRPGFKNLQEVVLENGLEIRILPPPYFLATKFEAFNDRGHEDYYASPDFEDIIYFLDNRTTIVQEISESDAEVRDFLREELTKLINHKQSDELLSMHISRYVVDERFPMLLEKINLILA